MPTSPLVMFSTRFLDDRTSGFLQKHAQLRTLAASAHAKEAEMSADELATLLDGVSGWIVGHARIDRAVLERIPSVRVIARRGVGYEKVDTEAAEQLGKVVTIARGGNEDTVADHALALMLGVARRVRESHDEMGKGRWGILIGSDLFAKTVGLVGDGWIARKVVRRLKGFDIKVLIHTRRPDPAYARSSGVDYVGLEQLLSESDFVSLHVPLNAQTRYIVDREALARMKPSAILVNTSRAQLVEEEALLEALEAGIIAGAGLDVLAGETDPCRRPLAERLLALPNVLATPHAAASTQEALARTNMIAAKSVVDVLNGENPPEECVVADGRAGKSRR